MAKVKYRIAEKNDPIDKEGFYVSSRMYSRDWRLVVGGCSMNTLLPLNSLGAG